MDHGGQRKSRLPFKGSLPFKRTLRFQNGCWNITIPNSYVEGLGLQEGKRYQFYIEVL